MKEKNVSRINHVVPFQELTWNPVCSSYIFHVLLEQNIKNNVYDKLN